METMANSGMADWYSKLEPEIRYIVKLLRDNGFNTTSSCGHQMYVEVDLMHLSDAEVLAICLVENGIENFRIECVLMKPPEGFWTRRAVIWIGKWNIEP